VKQQRKASHLPNKLKKLGLPIFQRVPYSETVTC
jgi:hypothetical protein